MAALTSEISIDDENESFNIFTPAPVPGTAYAAGGTNSLLRRIINDLAASSDGIAECLSCSLELDASDYHIGISGYPQQVANDRGKHLEYCIHISIHPIVDPSKPKTLRRMGKLPRATH